MKKPIAMLFTLLFFTNLYAQPKKLTRFLVRGDDMGLPIPAMKH